jgi:hypothetical protein
MKQLHRQTSAVAATRTARTRSAASVMVALLLTLVTSVIAGCVVVPVGYGHPPRHQGYYGRQGYYGAGYYWGGSYRGGYYRRG